MDAPLRSAVSTSMPEYRWIENHTASYEAIDQRLLALEKVLIKYPPPVVAIEHKLILEKIDKGSLVSVYI